MFDVEDFIAACRSALTETDAEKAIEELVARAVSDAGSLSRVLGEPEHAGFKALHRAPDLTLLDFTWPPWMLFKPHNHCMWSIVGIFSGREDNLFWRRTADRIEPAGARTLGVGDVAWLGCDIIHSVINPLGKMTRAIHVYGGDFFAPPQPRSEWDPDTLLERPWDIKHTQHLFAEAEARARTRA